MKETELIPTDITRQDNLAGVKQIENLMDPEIRAYRLKFNKTLEPIKVMLVNRKQELAKTQWLGFVEITRQSIIRNPDQYLGTGLPAQGTMISIVERIFDEFLEHQN